ncbi:hypothetical protein [uncultured Roseibium sp.]|uniref:hypothetical protein n=1 Tax=uncultured Roseibium sp. TaxID=1936171 RepID=UPI003217E743
MSVTKSILGADAFTIQRERTNLTREGVAGHLFSQQNIDAVLSAAAMDGQSVAIFEPPKPMDLSDTLTAKAAIAEFEKAGFLAEWKTRHKPDGESEKYLRVSWSRCE